ncbi:MAG: hypothetical protein EOO01_41390, partial [Chitinophagaceae bacterium]
MRKCALLFIALLLWNCREKKPATVPQSAPVDERTVGPVSFDSARLSVHKYKPLHNFYALKGFRTFWEDKKSRTHAIKVLADSYKLGFNPDSFHYSKICGFEKKYETLSDDSRVDYDVLLTYSIRKYLEAVNEGQTDIRKTKWNWAMHRRKRPITQYM